MGTEKTQTCSREEGEMRPISRLMNRTAVKMPLIGMINGALLVGPIAGVSLAGPAPVPTTGDEQESVPVFVMRCAGATAGLQDPKDAGLRRAMEALQLRIGELPAEISGLVALEDPGKAHEARQALELIAPWVATFLSSPVEFALIDNGENDFGVNDIDLRLVLDTGNPDKAAQLTNSLSNLLRLANPTFPLTPTDYDPNQLGVTTPFGTGMFGPADDDGRFVIGFDLGGDGLNANPVALTAPPEMDGIDPTMQVHVNLEAATDVVTQFIGMAGNQQAMAAFTEQSGQMLQGPKVINSATGYKNGRTVTVTRSEGINEQFIGMMNDASSAIETADLAMIPVDARTAQIASFDFNSLIDVMAVQIADRMGREVDELWDELDMHLDPIVQQIGVHPIHDVLDHLGTTWVMYTSDTTGGGGMASTVFINGGVNGPALHDSFSRLTTLANSLSAQAMGYVRVSSWDVSEIEGLAGSELLDGSAFSIQFPGLPIPLELSMALTEDQMVMAMSPQALVEAVRQCNGGHESLVDSPGFQDAWESLGMLKVNTDQITQLRFMDTPRLLDRGYPMMQLVGTAIANAVRSPSDFTRDPGLVMPTYNELREGAHASVSVTYVDGNDVVQIGTSDGSCLVNATGMAGSGGLLPLLLLGGGLAAMGAADQMH
ncbi:MAG: hypothetical protein D8M59_08640 [Planctomycetes bacterium]|nr:hypothetical protein [Planctomycetota bacterium]NOG53934.1 hypothetical protein [Planctomycetota bacterium]